MAKQRKRSKRRAVKQKKRRMAEHAREHRWNVIVGRNKFGENSGPVAYFKRDDPLDIELSYAGSIEVLSNDWYVFSDNEFSNLVACLRGQPDGDRLVKIAELGKVPAPEVDE